MTIYLGVDIGATKTQTLAVNEAGAAVALVSRGPGATYVVGYDGCGAVVSESIAAALQQAGAQPSDVAATGLGVSGYDWPSNLPPTLAAFEVAHIPGVWSVHNDGDLPLAGGTSQGWGAAVSAGTGNIVTAMDRQGRYARSTGGGIHYGELGGAMELVETALRAVAHQFIQRGPPTRITEALLAFTGAPEVAEMLDRIAGNEWTVSPDFGRQIMGLAREGDAVAVRLVREAGRDLGLTTLGVLRLLGLEAGPCEIVLSGSMFRGMLPHFVEPLREAILAEAAGARFVSMDVLPAIGGVILAMRKVGFDFLSLRERMVASVRSLLGPAQETAGAS